MTQLYSTLAEIYHEMYQHVFDYDKEFHYIENNQVYFVVLSDQHMLSTQLKTHAWYFQVSYHFFKITELSYRLVTFCILGVKPKQKTMLKC